MKYKDIMCFECNESMEYIDENRNWNGEIYRTYKCPKCERKIKIVDFIGET